MNSFLFYVNITFLFLINYILLVRAIEYNNEFNLINQKERRVKRDLDFDRKRFKIYRALEFGDEEDEYEESDNNDKESEINEYEDEIVTTEITTRKSIKQQESIDKKLEIDDKTTELDEYDYEIVEEKKYNETSSDENDMNYDDDIDDEDYADNTCSIDEFIDSLAKYLPSDYEEGKRKYKQHYRQKKKNEMSKETSHINETIIKIKRLYEYGSNLSSLLQPNIKRYMAKVMEYVYDIDIQPECVASLIKISQGIQNGDLWAIQCKNFKQFNNCLRFMC